MFSITPVLKRVFPQYIWEISGSKNDIYLTFDDGPVPGITDWVSDTLNDYQAKATFFCIGQNISASPNLLNRLLSEGHAIGNHTNNHLKGWNVPNAQYLDNIKECDKIIIKESKVEIPYKVFRPPYGKIKTSQAKEVLSLGYRIIMWSVIAYDWKRDFQPEKCLERVLANTKRGSIVVLHDSLKAEKNMKYVLPRMLEYFSEKGYNFKTLA